MEQSGGSLPWRWTDPGALEGQGWEQGWDPGGSACSGRLISLPSLPGEEVAGLSPCWWGPILPRAVVPPAVSPGLQRTRGSAPRKKRRSSTRGWRAGDPGRHSRHVPVKADVSVWGESGPSPALRLRPVVHFGSMTCNKLGHRWIILSHIQSIRDIVFTHLYYKNIYAWHNHKNIVIKIT